jgi:hypothetical protein
VSFIDPDQTVQELPIFLGVGCHHAGEFSASDLEDDFGITTSFAVHGAVMTDMQQLVVVTLLPSCDELQVGTILGGDGKFLAVTVGLDPVDDAVDYMVHFGLPWFWVGKGSGSCVFLGREKEKGGDFDRFGEITASHDGNFST